MHKKIIALIALAALLLSLSGCNFSLRESVEDQDAPTLPGFSFRSELICQVEGFENGKCVATVLEDNGTYDKDTTVLVTYETVADGLSLSAGNYITFAYSYTKDVTSLDGTPHIKTGEVTILPEYTPPETTAETTEETTEATN